MTTDSIGISHIQNYLETTKKLQSTSSMGQQEHGLDSAKEMFLAGMTGLATGESG